MGSPTNKRGKIVEKDLEFECEVTIPPAVSEGNYEVVFLRAERAWLWKCEKVFLWFQIVELGEFHGKRLYMACNVPKTKRWGVSSKYYQCWVLAAGRQPDRFDRMSTNVFRRKVFLAQVRTVRTNAQNLARPPLLQYSVIDRVLDRLTGSIQEKA